jgi:hypothetical protein
MRHSELTNPPQPLHERTVEQDHLGRQELDGSPDGIVEYLGVGWLELPTQAHARRFGPSSDEPRHGRA